MKKLSYIVISSFVFVFVAFQAAGQTCDKVLFTGKVIDSTRSQMFYNQMLVNKRTGQGVFGQPNGNFSIYVNNHDTVTISVKEYELVNIVVEADSNCQFKQKIYLDRKPIMMQEVVFHPLKSLEQIKEEREALALRETRQVTGIDVMQSPITALYQAFSQKERNKRWVAEQQYENSQRDIVKELLRNYVAYDIINLSEDEFDQFILFLNINDSFLKTATEMELITFIKDKYEHYKTLLNEQNR